MLTGTEDSPEGPVHSYSNVDVPSPADATSPSPPVTQEPPAAQPPAPAQSKPAGPPPDPVAMIATVPRALPAFALRMSALAVPVVLRGTDAAVAFALRYTLVHSPRGRAAATGIAVATTPRGKALMSTTAARRAFWQGVFAMVLRAERAPHADGSVSPASLLFGLMGTVAKVPLVKRAAKPETKPVARPTAKPRPAVGKPSGKNPAVGKPSGKLPAPAKNAPAKKPAT